MMVWSELTDKMPKYLCVLTSIVGHNLQQIMYLADVHSVRQSRCSREGEILYEEVFGRVWGRG